MSVTQSEPQNEDMVYDEDNDEAHSGRKDT